jgi:quinol monooxygenase YgiN
MIIVTLRVNVALDRKDEINKLFASYVGPVSVGSGCLAVCLYSDCVHPGNFLLIEEWRSRSFLQKHIRSRDFQKVLRIIDLAKELPEIRFHTTSTVEGFEVVEKLRKKAVLSYP